MMRKKQERPSPSESATEFAVGTIRTGNDKNKWIIKETTNGVKRWFPLAHMKQNDKQKENHEEKEKQKEKQNKSKKKEYIIHDNGADPFKVFILNDHEMQIYKNTTNDDEPPYEYDKLVKHYKNIETFFIGKSALKSDEGNSILAKLKDSANRYVFVGETIYEFTSPEPITHYYSLVGNSDVPYPVALSDKYVYFMIGPSLNWKEKKKVGGEYIEKSKFPPKTAWSDSYGEYYELFPQKFYKDRMGSKSPIHQFSQVKLVHKRHW